LGPKASLDHGRKELFTVPELEFRLLGRPALLAEICKEIKKKNKKKTAR
jgi:hypothetical protein